MRVFIYACENIYGGLHGMEDYGVYEVSSVEEANDIGREMSYGVINSYAEIGDSLEESARERLPNFMIRILMRLMKMKWLPI